jgi:hypothetical protein
MNLSISPLELLLGYVGVTGEFGISDKTTLGPYLSYFGTYGSIGSSSSSYQSVTLGAVSTFSLGHSRFTTGWYVQPFVQYSLKTSTIDFNGGALGIGSTVGYGWFWKNGMNLMLGLGAKYSRADFSIFGTAVGGYYLLPSALVQLGYAF